jgi:hypothetical protein
LQKFALLCADVRTIDAIIVFPFNSTHPWRDYDENVPFQWEICLPAHEKRAMGSPKVKGPFLSALAAYATNKLAGLGVLM